MCETGVLAWGIEWESLEFPSVLKDPSPTRHLSLDPLRLFLPVPNRGETTFTKGSTHALKQHLPYPRPRLLAPRPARHGTRFRHPGRLLPADLLRAARPASGGGDARDARGNRRVAGRVEDDRVERPPRLEL